MKVRVCGKNSIPFFHVDQAINLPSVQPIFRFNKKCKETRIQIDNTDLCRVSQKKVWFTPPGAKVYLFVCNSPVCRFFNIFLIFFCTPFAKKKIREPFFLSKSKFQKNKIVYVNYFYRNVKFCKDWIIESQKMAKF